MKTTKYAITFIDSKGEEQLLTKHGKITSMDAMPFHTSQANADKTAKAIMNIVKKGYLAAVKDSFDKAEANFTEGDEWYPLVKKQYDDLLLISANGVAVKEVNISIN